MVVEVYDKYSVNYYDHVTCMYSSGGGAAQVMEGRDSCSAQTCGSVTSFLPSQSQCSIYSPSDSVFWMSHELL